jgi:rod shape-determining protein MreC
MSNRLKFVFLIILLTIISINYADGLRGFANDISTFVVKQYMSVKTSIAQSVNEHFNQRDEIRVLREQNARLEEQTLTLNSFSDRLNSMLQEANLTKFAPKTKLVSALSYANLGDYNKVWLDFANFNASRIYGLIYQGYTAGIVTEKNGKALALLQYDPKSTFSVYMGKDKIKGIAFGVNSMIEIRYIPLWTEPHIGDEVLTSGLDGIFFEGTKVGQVIRVDKDDSYFTAVVEPYAIISVPSFFHVVLNN